MSSNLSGGVLLGPGKAGVRDWSSHGVWLVVWTSTLVSDDGGGSISEVSMNSSSVWAVNWDLLIVLSESISLSIWVREESSLEHLVV